MTDITTLPINTEIALPATDAIIEGYRQRLGGLTADTPQGYESVRLAIGELTKLRTDTEKARKKLKKPHWDQCQKIDELAKRADTAIREIEEPLRQRKLEVDNAVEEARKAAEAAQKAELEAREREERERIAAEQRIERERIAKEQAEFLAEKQALEDKQRQMQEEQDRMNAERREIEREKEEIEAARLKAIDDAKKAEALAKQKAEYEIAAKKAQAKIDAEAKKEKARLAAEEKKRKAEHVRLRKERQPDIDKLEDLAGLIATTGTGYEFSTEWAKDIHNGVRMSLIEIADEIRDAIQ